MNTARLLDLGLQPYRQVWDLQHALHERVRAGQDAETWIFVEHTPVVTLGRKAKESNVLLPRDALLARGVDVVEIERGGDVTYHGPGQLVVYPIRKLERFREVVPLVRALEGAVIDAVRAARDLRGALERSCRRLGWPQSDLRRWSGRAKDDLTARDRA